MPSIRNKNTNTNEYYIIYRNGLVIKNPSCERMKTYNIQTGDYEIYSPVQIIKSGYLRFKDSNTMIREMTSLYNIVSEIERSDIPREDKMRLMEYAKTHDCSASQIIRYLIRRYLFE